MEDCTTTKTVESESTDIQQQENEEVKEKVIKSPLFIMFAEYLGFVSKVLEWAEEWCNGKTIEEFKKKIIETDAINIYGEMKKKWTIEEIREWYDEFYSVILSEYDKKLEETK